MVPLVLGAARTVSKLLKRPSRVCLALRCRTRSRDACGRLSRRCAAFQAGARIHRGELRTHAILRVCRCAELRGGGPTFVTSAWSREWRLSGARALFLPPRASGSSVYEKSSDQDPIWHSALSPSRAPRRAWHDTPAARSLVSLLRAAHVTPTRTGRLRAAVCAAGCAPGRSIPARRVPLRTPSVRGTRAPGRADAACASRSWGPVRASPRGAASFPLPLSTEPRAWCLACHRVANRNSWHLGWPVVCRMSTIDTERYAASPIPVLAGCVDCAHLPRNTYLPTIFLDEGES